MHQAVLNTHRDLGFSLAACSQMASQSPAQFMSLQNTLGSIAIGQQANLLLLDNNLTINNIWLHGKPVAAEQEATA